MADMDPVFALLATLCALLNANIGHIIRSILLEVTKTFTTICTSVFVITADSYEFRSASRAPIELPFYLDNVLDFYIFLRYQLRYRFLIALPHVNLPYDENGKLLHSIAKGSAAHVWIVAAGLALAVTVVALTTLALHQTIKVIRRAASVLTGKRAIAMSIIAFITMLWVTALKPTISSYVNFCQRHLAAGMSIWIQLALDLYSQLRLINTEDSIIFSYQEVAPSLMSYGAILRASIKYNFSTASTLPMLVSRPRYHDILATETGYHVVESLIKFDKTPTTVVVFTLLSIAVGMLLSLSVFMLPYKRYLIIAARIFLERNASSSLLACLPILCLNTVGPLERRFPMLSKLSKLLALYLCVSPSFPLIGVLECRVTELRSMLKFDFGVYHENKALAIWQFQSPPPSEASPLALRLKMTASLLAGRIQGGFRWVQLAERWKMGSWNGSDAYFSQAVVYIKHGSGDWYLLQGILVALAVLLTWSIALLVIAVVLPTIVDAVVFTSDVARSCPQVVNAALKRVTPQTPVANPLPSIDIFSFVTPALAFAVKAWIWTWNEAVGLYSATGDIAAMMEHAYMELCTIPRVPHLQDETISGDEEQETTPRQRKQKESLSPEGKRPSLRIDISPPCDAIYSRNSPLQSTSTLVDSDEYDDDVDSDESDEVLEHKFWSDDASRRRPLSMKSPEYLHALSLGLANPPIAEAISGERPCNLPIGQIPEEPELEEGDAMQSTFPTTPNTPRFKHEPKIAPSLVLPASFTPPPNRPRAKTWSSPSTRPVIPQGR